MPIPSTGEIKLNDDVNATLQADTNESNVSLGDNNTVKFTAVGDGSTVSGRSMSELRGQTLFQIFPTTEATGALGKSLHMDGLSSSHNSVKVLEPTLTTAPVFTNTRGTFSFWIKIHETESSKRYLYTSGTADGSLVSILLHSSGTNHKLQVRINNLSYYITKAIFIDKAGWYNFVVSLDSNVPQDDIKVNCYANGIRLTWEQVANMSDGQAIQFGTNQRINDWAFADGYGADATYANFIFVDGSALLPNEFGELSNGIWVPKAVNTSSSQSLVTTNLVADYQFQGNANDTSVGGTTYNGTPSNVTFQQNNYNIASFTGGSASQISLGASSQFTSSTLTFSFWYMPTAAPSGTSYKILFSNYTTGSPNFNISRNTDNSLEFGVITGSSGTWYRKTGPNAVELNNWKHYAFVLDSSQSAEVDKIKVYINGNLTFHSNNSGTSTTGNFLNHSNNLLIGNWGHQSGYTDTSKFGELQIYTSALTETQVLQNFNATKYKYFYGLNGWHLNFNNSDEGSIVSGSVINLDAGDWDADGTDETSFSGTTWSDKSGNNHHATLTNGPTYSGNNGGYFLFDGSDDFATITSNSSFQSLADFSVEMWIYPVTVSNDEMINLLYTSGSNYKWDLRFSSGSSRNFRWTVADSGGNYSSAQDVITNTTTGTVPLNKWSHVTATFSSTNGISRVYINGALTDAKTGTFTTRTNGSENLLLAKRTDGYHANIGIAQSRVYSKALTAQEVVQNFRATQGHYEVLSLADISGNAKAAIVNGTNLNGSDHTGDKPDVSYATLSPLAKSSYITLSNGGTALTHSQSSWRAGNGTVAVSSGKWYYEVKMTAANTSGATANNAYFVAGWEDASLAGGYENAPFSTPYNRVIGVFDSGAFGVITNGTSPNYGTSNINSSSQFAVNDVLGIALDADTGSVQIYKNGSTLGSAVTLTADAYMVYYAKWSSTHGNGIFNFGAKGFAYTPPSGYKALSSDNLPTATGVDPVNQKKPRDYFESVTYNGTDVRNKIKSLDFQPDLVWVKNRDESSYHYLYNTVSEGNLYSDSTAAQDANSVAAYGTIFPNSNGFEVTKGSNSSSAGLNKGGKGYIAWAWKAGGAPTATNAASAGAAPTLGSVMIDGVASTASLAGTIVAKKISANTNAGFSIVKYTGNGIAGATIGHGLSSAPEFSIIKKLDTVGYSGGNWVVGYGSYNTDLYLNTAVAAGTNNYFWNSAPTSTVLEVKNDWFVNYSGAGYISYNFHSVDGYQKIGSYTGNGSSNGPFIYTGFKPAWVIIKSYSSGNSGDWMILDNARDPENTRNARIDANSQDDEATDAIMDFHSNGFKLITSSAAKNRDGYKFIYLAIAEDPAKYAQGTGQESDTEKFLEKGTGTTQYPANHFKTVLWTNPAGQQKKLISGVGFEPGLTWIKSRNSGTNNVLTDAVRGVTKTLESNTTDIEETVAQGLTAFNSDGFRLGTDSRFNPDERNNISWNWKAGDTIETKKPTYTSAGILTSNLVLHYNFADSNTYAGTGADLTNIATSSTVSNALQNSPTFVDRSYGNYFDLDGTNDYIRTDWQQNSSTTMTFETWQWVDNDSSYRYIWGDFNTSGTDTTGRFGTRIYNDNQVSVFIGNGTNNNNIASGILDYTPYLEKWTHFVWTINGTTGKLYINGILMSVKTFDYSLTANGTNNMALGNYTGGAITTQTFDGKFGQARIYTAELTQAQIRANYDATRTLYQGVGTTGNVLQTGLLNNIDLDSFDSYDPSKLGVSNKVIKFPGGSATGNDNGTGVNLPSTIDDPMRSASAFAISVWYKHDTPNNTHGNRIVHLLNNTYNFINANSNNAWYARVQQSNGSSVEISGLENFVAGTWYHLVWTGSASNGCTLYCNGVKQGNSAWDGTFTNYSSPYYQFNKLGHSGYEVAYMKGSMDMVRLYNKEVTNAEVKALFHETSATTGTLNPSSPSGFPSGCYAAYNFNSDSGTTVDDLSGNYDGTTYGSPTYEVDAAVTKWMVKDLTSNKHDLGAFYNATISNSNPWGRSIKFDGTGDFVSLPVGLGRTATQDVTRELWVKIDDLPTGSNSDGLLYIGDRSNNQYYENLRITSDGTIDYQERPTNSSGGSDFILSTSSYEGTLSEGAWYHVAYTSQGRIKKIYINGKLIASKTASSDRPNNSTYTGSLGSFRGGTVTTTQGEIAQFRSYTSALTDAQIKANYDATKAQFYSALMHSSVSVNEKAGFSIAKHKGDGVLSSRIIHGLSSQPDFLVVKNMDTASTSWATWLSVFSSPSETLFLDYAGRSTQYTNRFTNVSETTFQAGNAGSGTAASSEVNKDGDELIVYAWKSIPGYSKIGRYKGTGSSGHSIKIGFQPSWVMIKNITNTSSTGWVILDAARDSINDNGNAIFASASISEWGASNTTINIDFTPTGFEIQNSYVVVNGSSDSYIYMAFA